MDIHDLKEIIEATALREERKDSTAFSVDRTDEAAVSLWKQYASGEAGDEILEKALEIRDLTNSSLGDTLKHVKLTIDVETYISRPDAMWLIELSDIIDSYGKGYLFYADMFQHQCFPKGNITLCRALLPFYSAIAHDIVRRTNHDKGTALNIGFSCFELLEPICHDVFAVAAKSHFDVEDISKLYFTGGDGDDSEYLTWIYEGGILEIVKHYPMCFRLLMQAIARIENNLEIILRRLNNDIPTIEKLLLEGAHLGKLVDMKIGLSDLHNGGQSVCILSFSCGTKLVYKPRSMAVDAAWNKLLELLKTESDIFELSTLRVLNRGDYGYVTFAEQYPAKAVEKYYYNAGVIMCLASLFGATDLHYENIIAAGESPIIVDLETIISPRPRRMFAKIEGDNERLKAVDVGRTMLLPRWVGNSIRTAREIGGFTSISELGKNYHFVDGKKTSADQYPQEILSGFRDAYNYIISHRETVSALLQECNFASGKYRYVFRRTALYYNLYRHFLHAAFLRRASLYEAVVTRIGAGILLTFDSEKARTLWSMEQSEENAIYNGDIPYFYCSGNEKGISDIDGILIPDFFEDTPSDIVKKNLEQMTSDRLEYEANYIKNALILSNCQPQRTFSTELLSYQNIMRSRVSFDNTAISQEIERLHEQLDEYSIDGLRFAYYAPVRDDKTTRYNLNLLESSYYSGIWGVLMFHAAYAVWHKASELKDAVLKKVDELLLPYIKGDDESLYLQLGLAEGVAGVLRSVVCIASILNSPQLLNSAVVIANRIERSYLHRSRGTDLFGGIAGYLYVICQLYLLTRDKSLYKQILFACDELKRRVSFDSRSKSCVWKSEMEYAPLTGLAHGQAGFAMALSAACCIASDSELRKLVDQCLGYEETNYDRVHNNWYDFRKFLVARRDQDVSECYNKRFMFGCCAGTPGIGLSRISIMQKLNDQSQNEVISRAVDFCLNKPIIGNDSFCCGTAGWIDFLVEASILRKDESLLNEAKSLATSIIPSISGTEYILSNLKDIYDISLFKGISGIGYELIRTQMPRELPSPLIW